MIPLGERQLPDDYLKQFTKELEKDAPELLLEGNRQPSKEKFTFDVQWSIYQYSELTWELDLRTRVNYVYQYFRVAPEKMKGALILDAGCGNGTLTAGLAASGPEVIGLDYSCSVESGEREKKRFAGEGFERVHYVQGSVLSPPFAPDTFDAIYCDGVLHHTPSTRKSFCALAPLVKENGRFFVWLYRSDARGLYRLKLATAKKLQTILRPLPLPVMRTLCFGGAALLLARLRVLRLFGMGRRPMIPLKLKAVNLFDTLTPRYYHLHNFAEVREWFRADGFPEPIETTIPSLGNGGFGVMGVRHIREDLVGTRSATASRTSS
jgi:SAM-dependent methyltransferase